MLLRVVTSGRLPCVLIISCVLLTVLEIIGVRTMTEDEDCFFQKRMVFASTMSLGPYVFGTTLIHDLEAPFPNLAMQSWPLILLRGQYWVSGLAFCVILPCSAQHQGNFVYSQGDGRKNPNLLLGPQLNGKGLLDSST